MPSSDIPSSSPLSAAATAQDALAYYKAQYEQLEAELTDFQASSRELEAELEKDVEAAEERERKLQERVEGLGFEVDEWKSKYKQSKAEANAAQTALQKEITTLRDTNRTIHLKLRDIEVANDDFERQARNTSSSLQDLESKYNMGIERGVMLEEEVKVGEQEREALRIETQRLRDELSDLRVEAEVMQNKLRHAEGVAKRQHSRKPDPVNSSIARVHSPSSETTTSSPTIATPPTKSASSAASDAPTPPSPPISEASLPGATAAVVTPQMISRLSTVDSNITPRPSHYSAKPTRHSRRPSIPVANSSATPSVNRRSTINHRESLQMPSSGIPNSGSLHQIRGLIGKMQKLEERVHSARSRLPAPTSTPPRASPRSGSALSYSYIPPTVTVRSSKKRTGGSNATDSSVGSTAPLSTPQNKTQVARTSFGFRPSTPLNDSGATNITPSRPSSRSNLTHRQSLSNVNAAAAASYGRPSSRQSLSHHYQIAPSMNSRPSSRQSQSRASYVAASPDSRAISRQSITGARTPLGYYSSSTTSESRRPRSSLGGSYAHAHSAGTSYIEDYMKLEEENEALTPTPEGTKDSSARSAIPTPKLLAGKRSTAMLSSRTKNPNTSKRSREAEMAPPGWTNAGEESLSEIGETY